VEKIVGIYKITNKENGNFYIGSSVDISRRWKKHITLLHSNNHFNCHFQNAWNLYGEENFIFEILETCLKENMVEKEQSYIDKLNPSYNVSKNAAAFMLGVKRPESFKENLSILKKGNKYFLGKTHSEKTKAKLSVQKLGNDWNKGKPCKEETKIKIGIANKGHKVTQETRDKIGKPVAQFTKCGIFMAIYNSAMEAEIKTNTSRKHICSCCKGKRKTTGGYKWVYLKDYTQQKAMTEAIYKMLEKGDEQNAESKKVLEVSGQIR
jgi:group I intron endonuclease